MPEKRQHIDELFRNELSGGRSIPPPEVWNNISKGLKARKRSRIISQFARIAATITLLLGIGGGLIYVTRQDTLRDNYLSPEKTVIIPLPESSDMPAPPPAPLIIDEKEDIAEISSPSSADRKIDASKVQNDIIPEYSSRMKEYLLPEPPPSKTSEEIAYAETSDALKYMQERPSRPRDETLFTASGQKGKLIIGIAAAPAYSYRSLSNGYPGGSGKTDFNNAESGLASFSGGISITYIINDRLSVQSGLGLSRMGQSIGGGLIIKEFSELEYPAESQQLILEEGVHYEPNSLGMINTTNKYLVAEGKRKNLPFVGRSDHVRIIQGLYYMHTPLLIKYRLSNGDYSLVLSGGFGANILVGNSVTLKYPGENINLGQTLNLKNFGLSGILGIGIEHKLNENMLLIVEPKLNHFISPVNTRSYLHFHPYSLSLYTGISYRF
ncbi:MAG: hypothetical protein R6U58_14625 [Bacteroidales bacterium]